MQFAYARTIASFMIKLLICLSKLIFSSSISVFNSFHYWEKSLRLSRDYEYYLLGLSCRESNCYPFSQFVLFNSYGALKAISLLLDTVIAIPSF